MRGTRTLRRWLPCYGGLALLAACNQGQPGKDRGRAARGTETTPSAAVVVAAEGERPQPVRPPLPAAVAHTLQALREHELEIAPPLSPLQRLEFGLGRLAQATRDQVLFRDTRRGEIITGKTIGAVHALAHGSDGALFALGATEGVWLEARATTTRRFSRTPFLPDAMLFPVLEDPTHFDVYLLQEAKLLRFAFDNDGAAFAIIDSEFSLTGCRGAPVLLRDGAFVCRTEAGFLRQAPRGTRTAFRFSGLGLEPVRLLSANRLDELFAVSREGEVAHLRLQADGLVLARFRLPARPYATAANREALAFVLVSAPEPEKPRRWTLLVTNFEGQPLFETELFARPAPAEEDWLQVVLEDKNLALSWYEPVVAVGGGSAVTVWDYGTGQPRFTR